MEPSGRNRWQPSANRSALQTAHTSQFAAVGYAVFQGSESGQFLHLYTDEGAASGTLQQLPAFAAFVSDAAARHEKPAVFSSFELVGAYRTFDDPDKQAGE